ncbi:hydrolase, alpha/beta domain protein [Dictyocaulus viviparus]|uniref:Hydrolase, alpha/beta domain protein n=1 Tax=Dictyocaulus viviparus TaxID=29172 RepID=A0A0D8Y0M3_DICVI|nr:hydrolase, alpha/beta domain protein [Dictyocaulus viviparus]
MDFEHADELRVMKRELCPAHDRVWSETRDRGSKVLKILKRILHAIGGVLYIVCPPWPPWVIKKIAFRAPPRGEYYYLVGGKTDQRRVFFKASEAQGVEDLQICLPHLLRPRVKAIDIYYHILRCKVDIADFLKCDLLVFDYPGYGISDGKSTEKGVYDTVERVFKYAVTDLQYQPEDIILIGFSLGTAAMVHIASITTHLAVRMALYSSDANNFKLSAMVLIAPFTSLWRVILRRPYTPKRLRSNPLRPESSSSASLSYEKAHNIRCPTLVCHGNQDVIVDHQHGLAMKERIANCELFIISASHQRKGNYVSEQYSFVAGCSRNRRYLQRKQTHEQTSYSFVHVVHDQVFYTQSLSIRGLWDPNGITLAIDS